MNEQNNSGGGKKKYGRVQIYILQQKNGAPLRSGLRHITTGSFDIDYRWQRHHFSNVVENCHGAC
jgi:hypothetical protein